MIPKIRFLKLQFQILRFTINKYFSPRIISNSIYKLSRGNYLSKLFRTFNMFKEGV